METTDDRSGSWKQPMTRRQAMRIFGGGALALSAAACGVGGTGSEPQAGVSPGGGTPTAGKTQIRYWTWMRSNEPDNPRAAAQAKILDAFRASNPDIDVVEEIVAWDELQQQIRQAAAAGRAPDVCRQLDAHVASLARDGSIEPLDDLIAASGTGEGDFLYPWDDTVVDGSKYAFRHSLRVANFTFYRPDLYQAQGIEEPSTDLSEFVSQMKQLTSPPAIGFLIPFGKGDQFNRFMQTVPPLWWAEGSDLVHPETGEPMFHEEAGQRIFQWFQDLIHEQKVMPSSVATMDSETANQMFQGSSLATTWHHSSQWSEWSSLAESGKLGMAKQLSLTGGIAPASSEGGWTLCMGKGAKREAAWRLIEFFHSVEAEVIDGEIAGELPTRKASLEEPVFQGEDFAMQRDWLAYLSEEGHPATSIKIPRRTQFVDILANAAQEIVVSQADVAATLEAAAERYAAL